MIWHVKTNCITAFDIHSFRKPSREELDALFEAAVGDAFTRGTVDEGNTVGLAGRRSVSDCFPLKHKGVNVGVGYGRVLPWRTNNMIGVNLDVGHGKFCREKRKGEQVF
jgi:hypothetical protein